MLDWIRHNALAAAVFSFATILTVAIIIQACISRSELAQMQKAQRPFVFTNATVANDWTRDTEHTMQITIIAHNASEFPAVDVVYSERIVVMETKEEVAEKLKHCPKTFSYPPHHGDDLAPASLLAESTRYLPTAQTDDISDKSRIALGIDEVIIYGGIKYSGIAGGDFETQYCFKYLPTGSFRWGTCTCQAFRG